MHKKQYIIWKKKENKCQFKEKTNAHWMKEWTNKPDFKSI